MSMSIYLLTIAGIHSNQRLFQKFKYGEIGTIVSVWKNFFKLKHHVLYLVAKKIYQICKYETGIY